MGRLLMMVGVLWWEVVLRVVGVVKVLLRWLRRLLMEGRLVEHGMVDGLNGIDWLVGDHLVHLGHHVGHELIGARGGRRR